MCSEVGKPGGGKPFGTASAQPAEHVHDAREMRRHDLWS